MMSEFTVVMAIRKEMKLYQRSMKDVVDQGEYTLGLVNGLVRAMGIVVECARAHNEEDKKWRKQARFFSAPWLLRKIVRAHQLMIAGEPKTARTELYAIILQSQKGVL